MLLLLKSRAFFEARNTPMNEQPTYTIILRWSEKQGAYIGQVVDLVGVEGTGSTHEEALASTLEAIRWCGKR